MSEILPIRSLQAENCERKASSKENLLSKIVDVLDKNTLPDISQFYAEDYLSVENISIVVDKIGELAFPLSDNCIEKLVDISTKAHFGSGEKTVLDENVRDTHVITSNKLRISFNQQTLENVMNKLKITLGLGDNCVLIPHLHNMLIYRAGQFFNKHQDSEKLENMIGTLVIVLPNAHIGGDLVIEFGEKKHIFSSESIKPVKAKCIAFYADCNHEIEKVKDGHRIALTYNLVLKTEELVLPTPANTQLCEAIKEYFDLKENEQQLIYFLNHSYTEHSLRWNVLKGTDRINSFALLSAAKQLGLIPHLALVEIREHWSAEAYDFVDDLIEDEITLSFWIDSDNKKVPFSEYDISPSNICFTKETNSFEPFRKEYEDFTGNAGNTMDYWYRRAAIVLWSESVKYSMNFLLSFDYAFEELMELCKTPGNKIKVMEIVTQAGKYLYNSNSECYSYYTGLTDEQKKNILNLSTIALYTEDSEIAFSLMSNSMWKTLNCNFAEQLSKLQFKYGIQWCINLLNKMKTNSRDLNIDNSNLLIKSFLEHKVDTLIVKLVLECEYEVITKKNNSFNDLPKRIKKLHEFFKSCLICEDCIILSKMIQHVVSNIQLYPLTNLTELYVELHENTEPLKRVHFEELRSYLTKTIEHKIISGVQSKDDWTIATLLPCKCANCAIANGFLQSKTQIIMTWPLQEKFRKHIMHNFAISRLPVKLIVESSGRPHKLILVKTDELHKNISEKFEGLRLCQQKLRALND